MTTHKYKPDKPVTYAYKMAQYLETLQVFLFIGKVGSGKGSLADLLHNYVKTAPNGPRDIIRIRKKQFSILFEQFTGEEVLIFDGPLLTKDDVTFFKKVTDYYEEDAQLTVLSLIISNKTAKKRLISQKHFNEVDMKTIEEKFSLFEREVGSVFEHMKQSSVFRIIEIDAEQPVEVAALQMIKEIVA